MTKTIDCDKCNGRGEFREYPSDHKNIRAGVKPETSYWCSCDKCGGVGKLTEEVRNDAENYSEYFARCFEDIGSGFHSEDEVLRWCFHNPRKMKPESKAKCIHSWFRAISTSDSTTSFRCAHCGTIIELK